LSNAVDPGKVIDLSDRLAANGRLKWDVPDGEWTILRMGRRSTGASTRPAPEPGIGFDHDKLDKTALEDHFDHYYGKLLEKIVELVEAGAVVLGAPPVASPSLSGYPQCDAKVRKLAGGLWGETS
jgi:hypothetical protein